MSTQEARYVLRHVAAATFDGIVVLGAMMIRFEEYGESAVQPTTVDAKRAAA